MNCNVDICYYVEQCTELEREIDEGLKTIQDTDGIERRNLIKVLESKVELVKKYVATIRMEITDVYDEDDQERYNEEYEKHNNEIKKLEEQVNSAGKISQVQEKARASGNEIKDVMNKATDLQQIQTKSLDNSITKITNILEEGNRTLIEIDRQKNYLEVIQNDLIETDSELNRAKKVLRNMFVKAIRDKCVIILLILVFLSIVAILIVECIQPGAIKKQYNGWFKSESGN